MILASEKRCENEELLRAGKLLGFCARDYDPVSPYLDVNSDLTLERAPISLVHGSNIATAANWMPMYDFVEDDCDRILLPIVQALNATGSSLSAEDYGYWTRSYSLAGSQEKCVAYVMPLMLEDGTVYGFFGLELECSYLQVLLPASELLQEGRGEYILAVREEDGTVTPVFSSNAEIAASERIDLQKERDGQTIFCMGERTYATAVSPMSLYESNTPFSGQEWLLIGAAEEETLYSFQMSVMRLLAVAFVILLLLGLLGSLLVSRNITRPIRVLSKEVKDTNAEHLRQIPELSATGIREIDQFSGAIMDLSRSVLESSTRFLEIIEMASVKLGGFEMRRDEDTVFVTDSFFELFDREADVSKSWTVAEFSAVLNDLKQLQIPAENEQAANLYAIHLTGEAYRYVRMQSTTIEDRVVGVAEDVTATVVERMRIEHERDYDQLTGLCNRHAISKVLKGLFKQPEQLGCATMLVLDLDDLKAVNDRYGHDAGDKYISLMGRCLRNSVPRSTLCARMSGDEFQLFFYGYADREMIREHIRKLYEHLDAANILMPDGTNLPLRASCGVSWYPQDATFSGLLTRYADFAMYQVKRSNKGGVAEFDRLAYERNSASARREEEFQKVLEESLVTYHLQPIVCTQTGKVFAYESLMRVNMPTLRSPEQVIDIAHKHHRLAELERLTWFKATENYIQLRERGLLDPDAYLFINSFASQHMSEEDTRLYHQRFAHVQDRMVVEIVEVDYLDEEAVRIKRETPGFTGMFALDDFGSGYNSEKNLLELSPEFVKVDISIIRNIDTDPDKQQIVSNIVNYAHSRNMRIVAEGVETLLELETVIHLKVDLVQGYFLARPVAVPSEISQEAAACIRRCAECANAARSGNLGLYGR